MKRTKTTSVCPLSPERVMRVIRCFPAFPELPFASPWPPPLMCVRRGLAAGGAVPATAGGLMRGPGRRCCGRVPCVALPVAGDGRDRLALRPAGQAIGMGDGGDGLAVLVARGMKMLSLGARRRAMPLVAGRGACWRCGRPAYWRGMSSKDGRPRADAGQHPGGEALDGVRVCGGDGGADGDRQRCGDEHGRGRYVPPALPDAPTRDSSHRRTATAR